MAPRTDNPGKTGGGREGGAAMRLRGLMRKEFLQIVRDPSSIAIAFLLPAFLLIIHGYGVSLDAEDVPLAVVSDGLDAGASSLIAAFEHSRYFRTRRYISARAAFEALRNHEADAVVRLRANFSEALRRPGETAPVQVILNGVDANTARIISGYAEGVWLTWLSARARMQGKDVRLPVRPAERIWYNSERRSRYFLVPGLIAVNMTLIGALLTAMVMAREWERGTMEALMTTPVSVPEILLGKLAPYFMLGMGGMALSVAMALWVFDAPLRGSLIVLTAVSSTFLLTALGMGLLISIVARNQFAAGQIAIIVTFLPAFLLSGYIFDIQSMPLAVQGVTYAVAARYFIAVLQSLFLAGTVWSVIWKNSLALAAMALFFLSLCFIKFKKRLD